MNNCQQASVAWLDRSSCPERPPTLHVQTDQARAPLTFGWWAQTASDRVSKFFHIETIYRLDREAGDGHTTRLVPSPMYGMTERTGREFLMARQRALLPQLGAGYTWIGPVLIEDVQGSPRELDEPFYSRLLPAETRAKLALAQSVAASLLARAADRAAEAP